MPKRAVRPEDLLRYVLVGDPQISPDGSRLVFTRKHIGDKNRVIANLYVTDRDGQTRPFTSGEDANSGARWMPDGRTILFVSGRNKPADQFFLISAEGGEAQVLSNLPEGSIGEYRISPDGETLAFTFRETPEHLTEAATKEREAKGGSTPPIEIDRLPYRQDADGYFAGQRFDLYVLSLKTGAHRRLYGVPGVSVETFDWSPNSAELVVLHSANRQPYFDDYNDQLWRVNLEGQSWLVEGLAKGPKGAVRWSPDGRWFAFAGNPEEQGWGSRNEPLYIVPAEGGAVKATTATLDVDLGAYTLGDTKDAAPEISIEWLPDSQRVVMLIGRYGAVQLAELSLDGEFKILTEGSHYLTIGNISADGRRIAATYGTGTRIPELAVIEPEIGTGRAVPHVLTHLNEAFYDEVKLSEPEEVWLDSTDGARVHAWVIKPIDYLEPKRYPAVLEIHGGPHAQYGWAYFHEFQVLAAAGYVVVYSNPRGSKGYGEAHCRAIDGDWGNRDWEDIQTVTRWMQHQPYIHPGQMGVMGGSYGGYMTNWVISHTNEFRAAITDRCVSNFVSMSGSSDFPFNRGGVFGEGWFGPLEKIANLWRQSPMAYFDQVQTPTLVIHSVGDLRCNIEQSEQVFAALQERGIESRFVRYPVNTSHGMSRNGPADLRIHRLGEILAWWKRFLG